MIITYKRASLIGKLSNVLFSSDEQKIAAMDKQAKIQRVQRTTMPYKARLAAIQAVSNSKAVAKVW